MTAPSRESETEFEPVYHHYGPHRAGLPPLVPYFRELWHRRAFAAEMSKATMRGANTTTFFGQAWLVLNPLLLAGVYYLLVTIIRRRPRPGAVRPPDARPVRVQPGRDLHHHRSHLGDQLGQAADQHGVPAAADPARRRSGPRSSASCRPIPVYFFFHFDLPDPRLAPADDPVAVLPGAR